MATIDGSTTFCPVEGIHGRSITDGMTEDEKKGLEAMRARLNTVNSSENIRRRVLAYKNGHSNGHHALAV